MSNWQKLKAKLDVAATGASPKHKQAADNAINGHSSGLKRKRSALDNDDDDDNKKSQSRTKLKDGKTKLKTGRKRHAQEVSLDRSPAAAKPISKSAHTIGERHTKSISTGDTADGVTTPDSSGDGPTLISTQPLENAVPLDTKDRSAKIGKYLALDCEMVGSVDPTNPRREISILARVSLTNYHGHVVYDSYVSPEPGVVIRDYRTWVSGIQPRHLYKAPSFSSVQEKVRDLLSGRIVVGHALGNDFKVLSYRHPRHLVRDTSLFPAFKHYGTGKTPPLKVVAAAELKLDIQGASHSSVEDARACMLLYRKYKGEFESGAKRASS